MRQHEAISDPLEIPAALAPGGHLHLAADHGIAGDMLLGALLDLGVPVEALTSLPPSFPRHRAQVSRIRRRGLLCTRVQIEGEEAAPPRRGLAELEALCGAPELPPAVASQARRVFRLLAEAESRVHGVPAEEIHFHEVGAVDSLVDVVATLRAVHLLAPVSISCSSIPLGSGTVETAHGRLPVPAPATLRLLEGVETHPLPVGREVSTPTGVALARVLADRFGPPPAGRLLASGTAAGAREAAPHEPPNWLRALLFAVPTPAEWEEIVLLETNVDDLPGEDAGHLVDSLRQAGALDVFLTATIHKKSRPGILISVICPRGEEDVLEERLFLESGTLGIRRQTVARRVLPRSWATVEVQGESVRVKCAYLGGRRVVAAPEYDDLRRLAERTGLPLSRLRQEVDRALERQKPGIGDE